MGFRSPNQSLGATSAHVGHSSQPPRGTPSDGMAVPGRATAAPGKIAPPNNDSMRFHLPTPPADQFPPAPKKLGTGDVPVSPWNSAGMLNTADKITPATLVPREPPARG